MEVRVLEHRESEFVERLKTTLNEAFNPIGMSFDINYFIGESTANKGKLLCFIIQCSKTGIIYEKIIEMKPHETPMDVEDNFVDMIVGELLLSGVTFLNIEKIRTFNPLFNKQKLKEQIKMN